MGSVHSEVTLNRHTRLFVALLVLLLGLATLLAGPVAAAPSFSIGATSASPDPVNRGATTTITTSVTNTGTTASGIIIDTSSTCGTTTRRR
jgi:hypothetical protein